MNALSISICYLYENFGSRQGSAQSSSVSASLHWQAGLCCYWFNIAGGQIPGTELSSIMNFIGIHIRAMVMVTSITHHSGCLAGVAKISGFLYEPSPLTLRKQEDENHGLNSNSGARSLWMHLCPQVFACHLSCHHGLFIHGFRILIQSWPESWNLLGTRTKLFLLSLDWLYPPNIIFSGFYCRDSIHLKLATWLLTRLFCCVSPFVIFFSAICRHFNITSVHSTSTYTVCSMRED